MSQGGAQGGASSGAGRTKASRERERKSLGTVAYNLKKAARQKIHRLNKKKQDSPAMIEIKRKKETKRRNERRKRQKEKENLGSSPTY